MVAFTLLMALPPKPPLPGTLPSLSHAVTVASFTQAVQQAAQPWQTPGQPITSGAFCFLDEAFLICTFHPRVLHY